MPNMLIAWIATVGVFVLNLYALLKTNDSLTLPKKQKLIQMLLVFALPLLGALIVLFLMKVSSPQNVASKERPRDDTPNVFT